MSHTRQRWRLYAAGSFLIAIACYLNEGMASALIALGIAAIMAAFGSAMTNS